MNLNKYIKVKLFSVKGVPIYMGWSLYPIVALVLIGLFSDFSILIGTLSWWGVMLLHELGHMWLARRSKISVLEIQLHLFHGLCLHEESDFPYINYLIAWGGVLAQLVFAIPCLIILVLSNSELPWYLVTTLLIFGPFSLVIALINLAPAEGLDGSICWKAIPLYIKHKKPKKKKNPLRVVK